MACSVHGKGHVFKYIVIVVQSPSRVWHFVTSWTAAREAFLSFNISWSILKLTSIESVMPSYHLDYCHPFLLSPFFFSCLQSFPASASFPKCLLFASGDQSSGASAWPSVQFSSVQSLSPVRSLCNPMNCRMPGLPVHHQLPEFTQTHVHRVDDAIQPSHPLSSPSPPALNLSQHQGLF